MGMRESHRAACNGKRKHTTKRFAVEARKRMQKIGKIRRKTELTPYLCTACGYWHLGHGVNAAAVKVRQRRKRDGDDPQGTSRQAEADREVLPEPHGG